VLQGIEGEVGQTGDVRALGVDPEHAALVSRSVTELEHERLRIAMESAAPSDRRRRQPLLFPL
jgi:hypothetical protein